MSTVSPDGLGQVRDWMSRNPVTVPPDSPVAHVIGLMRVDGIRHVLVVDEGQLVGIVSNRDVRSLLIDGEPHVLPASPISRVMSDSPVTTSPEVPLTEAARAMLERKIGALPVLDRDRPVGILTRSDALEALLAWADSAPTRREAGLSAIAPSAARPASATSSKPQEGREQATPGPSG
jgi:CBS domain-containing protein